LINLQNLVEDLVENALRTDIKKPEVTQRGLFQRLDSLVNDSALDGIPIRKLSVEDELNHPSCLERALTAMVGLSLSRGSLDHILQVVNTLIELPEDKGGAAHAVVGESSTASCTPLQLQVLPFLERLQGYKVEHTTTYVNLCAHVRDHCILP
jgi:hypothetical protein